MTLMTRITPEADAPSEHLHRFKIRENQFNLRHPRSIHFFLLLGRLG